MDARHDALCGAAELALAAERCGVTATVGRLEVRPGASNVIPGWTALTLDVRHARDARRRAAVAALARTAETIARRRGLTLTWTPVQSSDAVDCDRAWTKQLASCVAARGFEAVSLSSGAGHDGVALSALGPIAMLFVRCKGGVSHHPDESVKTADVAHAIAVLARFVGGLGREAGKQGSRAGEQHRRSEEQKSRGAEWTPHSGTEQAKYLKPVA
jgi:allantoate deiminase